MAIAGDVHAGSEFILAFSEESTFGTAITGTTTDLWKLMHLTENSEWDLSGIVRDQTPRMDGTRMPQNTDYYVTRAGGTIVIPFTTVLTDLTLDFLLYLVMQDLVSEDASTPYEKIFEWDNSTNQPDFIANAGKFVTVVQNGGISSEDMIATSCILQTLTITSDPGVNGGRLTASGSFMSGFSSSSKFFESGSQSFGTATQPGTDYYNHCNLVTKTIAGADMVMESWSVTFDNLAKRGGCDASGDTELYTLGIPKYALTGTVRVLYDANSKPFLTNSLTSGFDTQIILAYGSGNDPVDTDGDLLFKFNSNFEASPTKDFAGEAGTMLDLTFSGAGDGTNENAEVEIANNVDRAW